MNNSLLIETKNIIDYLVSQGLFREITSVKPIDNGASGAKLLDITDKYGRYVIKHMHKLFCENNSNMLSSYEREWKFYSIFKENSMFIIPKVIHIEENSDYGMIIVFPHW